MLTYLLPIVKDFNLKSFYMRTFSVPYGPNETIKISYKALLNKGYSQFPYVRISYIGTIILGRLCRQIQPNFTHRLHPHTYFITPAKGVYQCYAKIKNLFIKHGILQRYFHIKNPFYECGVADAIYKHLNHPESVSNDSGKNTYDSVKFLNNSYYEIRMLPMLVANESPPNVPNPLHNSLFHKHERTDWTWQCLFNKGDYVTNNKGDSV